MTIEEALEWGVQGQDKGRLARPGRGVVLECTDRGILLTIRRDDLGLLHGITPGTSFHHLVDRDSLDIAFAFLAELRHRYSAFGWDLKVSLNCQPTTLCWGGIQEDGRLRIFGTKTRGELLRFSRYFMDYGLLRAVDQAIREQIGLAQVEAPEQTLLEKLSCANNQLLMLQRAFARKTAALKRVIAELRATRARTRTLPALIPICSSCKKIRGDDDNWVQVETYFKHHAGVQFTHSICPECTQILYPGLHLRK